MADAQRDQHSTAYTSTCRGQLYGVAYRYRENLQWTRHAAYAAQRVPLPKLLYLWAVVNEWLRYATGNLQGAIDVHRPAINTLQSIWHEMGGVYKRRSAWLRKAAGPVYLDESTGC